MGLDANVRCTCIQDGRAKPHPLPEKLVIDETGEPTLAGNASIEEWTAHDRWYASSCEHGGILLSERLGNVSAIAHLRELLHRLERDPEPRFPILLTKIVYSGTHSGDWIASSIAPVLLKEVDAVVHSEHVLDASAKEFFDSIKRLCEASIAAGNPINF
jgi:hypothetical protein